MTNQALNSLGIHMKGCSLKASKNLLYQDFSYVISNTLTSRLKIDALHLCKHNKVLNVIDMVRKLKDNISMYRKRANPITPYSYLATCEGHLF